MVSCDDSGSTPLAASSGRLMADALLLLLPLLLSAASAMLLTPAAPIPQFCSSTC